jgi:nitrate reductase gamma subunit
MALAGAIMLAHRRLTDPRIRATSTVADIGILLILILQLLLGLISVPISLMHLDGLEMVKLMAWANGIFTLDGNAASYIEDVNIIFKLHIVLGLTIFILFPFTRLVHMVSAPVRYLWRPGYQIVRTRKNNTLSAGK